ncbi:MAG TPA: AAA-like domain-containing protein [Terrimicrobiaceae bacterium]
MLKGARQMGKTSLLSRALEQARGSGFRVAITDFQKLDAAHLESIESFFQALGAMIAIQLDNGKSFMMGMAAPSTNVVRP